MDELKDWIGLLISAVSLAQGIKMLVEKSPENKQPPNASAQGNTKAQKPRLTRKQRRKFVGSGLVVIPIIFLCGLFWPEPSLASMTPAALLKKAWQNNDRQKWDAVERYASQVVTRFDESTVVKALDQLKKDLKPSPKTGIVGKQLTEQDAINNHEYGFINDYATAHFLLGQALLAKNNRVKAEEHFQDVLKFPDAVTYNPQTNEFWRTADGAENALLQLRKQPQGQPAP